jgi:hypothetical protein
LHHQILSPDDTAGVSSRRTIALSFGILYSREKYPAADQVVSPSITDQHPSEESIFVKPDKVRRNSSGRPNASQEQVWLSLGASAMTAMVLMLDYVGILANVIHAQYSSWSLSNLASMLRCLEVSYHHARCFNAATELRMKLWKKGFMRFADNSKRLPHLVEQETASLAQILTLAFRLYAQDADSHADASARAGFAEPIIERYTLL